MGLAVIGGGGGGGYVSNRGGGVMVVIGGGGGGVMLGRYWELYLIVVIITYLGIHLYRLYLTIIHSG